ncbi:DUF21 domain-containing protein [Motiliproteus sediminis]|uniref:DUF21 domain-containing protein n=1 Tax=Motiliproteus sediminis TaxID=1468178 RepID=UPI001AEFFB31|nr:DUF21 domain-containing protein [Motiliproteus sediminis]
MGDGLIWLGILFCISQSACFSGLNLAFFSLSRMQLEIESARGDKQAARVLLLRQDTNFLLTTILWGNVGINVLLTLLSNSVMTGLAGFLFSTFAITLFGEIGPQAYFSRNAKIMASWLAPLLRFYQLLLWPLAKPCALLLDSWLGKEGIDYMLERDLRAMLRKYVESADAEVDALEGVGALNFLAIDDLPASLEGEPIDALSVIPLVEKNGRLDFPEFQRRAEDPFLQAVNRSGYSWVVLTDGEGLPHWVLDADGFLRHALLEPDKQLPPLAYCHRPLVVNRETETLGAAMLELKLTESTGHNGDEAIVKDVILVWTDSSRRIITGADILGRLLKGVDRYVSGPARRPQAG